MSKWDLQDKWAPKATRINTGNKNITRRGKRMELKESRHFDILPKTGERWSPSAMNRCENSENKNYPLDASRFNCMRSLGYKLYVITKTWGKKSSK